MRFNILDIARVCHETNRVYCQIIGDYTQPTWEFAPQWQRDSAINGVNFHLANLDATPEDSHNNWLEEKRKDDWCFGPVKNAVTKEHPCFRAYSELPVEQRVKDHLFCSIVHSMAQD